MTFGEKIKARRIELGLSQDELSAKLGYAGRSSISRIEKDERDVPIDKVKAIADALFVTPGYLMGWDDDESGIIPRGCLPVSKKKFAVLGEIACGQPIFAEESHDTYIEASADINADFCLIAKGDSMVDARINDGDVVFVRSMSMVDNGSIAVVAIDDEATLKRWYFYPDKRKLVLMPANPKYAPMVYVGSELNDVRCLGKAVCFMSNL